MAEALAECGADLVLCARNRERCDEVAASSVRARGAGLGLGCDVREPDEVDVVSTAVDELGRIDILVNNSGTSWRASPEDVPLDGWQKVIDVNLTGAFLFAQAVGRALIAQGRGWEIVNISSVAAFTRRDPPRR